MDIYGLMDPRDGLFHYVGKTNKANRRLIEHRNEHGRVNPEKTHWLDALAENGFQPAMVILETCADDQAEARELHWIRYGREQGWPLVNKAHGYETTARKIGQLIEKGVKFGLLPAAANGHSDKAKRLILGLMVENAERQLKASYEAEEAARQHAEALETLLRQVADTVHEIAEEA